MKTMTPFSDKILFFDAEFTSLEYEKSALLSFGAVTLAGETYYCEIAQDAQVMAQASPFVQEHILPMLNGEKITMAQAREEIAAFVRTHYGVSQPYLTTFVYKYDAYHWYKLFGYDDTLAHRIILDFASMLFALGIDPEKNSAVQRDDFLRALGIDVDRFAKHNALDDALILREAYMALTGKVR